MSATVDTNILLYAANADDEIEQLCDVLGQMVDRFDLQPVDNLIAA